MTANLSLVPAVQTHEHISTDYSHEYAAGNIKATMANGVGKSRDLWMVSPKNLVILEEFNVRPKDDVYHAAVRAVADSIKVNGFYSHKPFACIVIEKDGVDVIAVYDGHTRYDGLNLAVSEGFQVERVPVVVAPSGTTLEDITVGLVTNNNGSPLPPMGIAVVCKRMVGYGLDNTEIARRLGFTPAYVGGLLSLIGAPKKIRDLVNEGKVSATLAVATLRDNGSDAVAVLENGLVVAEANGKTKVTKKNLVAEKPVVRKATKSSPILIAGLAWINDNGQMEHSYALLAALTGKSIDELKKM